MSALDERSSFNPGTGLNKPPPARPTDKDRTIADAALDLIVASKDGLTNQEIADALDLPVEAVRQVTYRLWSARGQKIRSASERPGVPLRWVAA
jgi:DNA-binding NarL/FixJ family response regulator